MWTHLAIDATHFRPARVDGRSAGAISAPAARRRERRVEADRAPTIDAASAKGRESGDGRRTRTAAHAVDA